MVSFGDNDINLELPAWMQDLESGRGNLVSDLNLALYRSFAVNGIEIPFPRRDIRALDKVEPGQTGPIWGHAPRLLPKFTLRNGALTVQFRTLSF
ncbi:MAG TPA: hypothetical protein VFV71_13110 [Burkholderiales bacterium]|nr:hypothetical protein [Burkholderiales bacterium]